MFGFDSYAGLNAVSYGIFTPFGEKYPVWSLVLNFIPNSIFFIKFLLFLSLLFGLLPIWLVVKHFYDSRLAWLSVFLLVGLSPLVLFSFGEFENEIFAYPFILWAIYFFLTKKFVKSFFALVVGSSFWYWFYYFFISQKWFSPVVEMNMFHGLLDAWFLLPFIFGVAFLSGQKKWLGLLAFGGWLWNAKLFVFLLPFLALSMANVLFVLQNYEGKHMKIMQKGKIYSKYVFIIAFFGLLAWNVTFLLQSPNQNDWELVDLAIKESQDKNLPLYPDLGWDYWVTYKLGKETVANQQLWGDLNIQGSYIWLTSQTNQNCIMLAEKKEIASTKKIWQCN